ncbi:MAG: hypothetical protein IJY22_02820 [Clostridia bacterium]|nr:hypothetical protein [Clostridia bacterium]
MENLFESFGKTEGKTFSVFPFLALRGKAETKFGEKTAQSGRGMTKSDVLLSHARFFSTLRFVESRFLKGKSLDRDLFLRYTGAVENLRYKGETVC